MASKDSLKNEFTYWQVLAAGLCGKKQAGLAFDLERENVAGLARSLWAGEMPLNDLHRSINRVWATLRDTGVDSLDVLAGEYKGRMGSIDILGWPSEMDEPDALNAGPLMILPWADDMDELKAERFALNFAIGALALTSGNDYRDVTIAWVSRAQNIRTSGGMADHLIRTYSREQARTKELWTDFVGMMNLGSQVLGDGAATEAPKPAVKTLPAKVEPPFKRDQPPAAAPIVAPPTQSDEPPTVVALAQIAAELSAIRLGLEAIAQALEGNKPFQPFVYPLNRFKGFDFASIGIEVEASDEQGPTLVIYRGQIYTRRSPTNKKFAPVIFYSRAIGKDDEDNNNYECLIKFKTFSDAESLDPRAKELAGFK